MIAAFDRLGVAQELDDREGEAEAQHDLAQIIDSITADLLADLRKAEAAGDASGAQEASEAVVLLAESTKKRRQFQALDKIILRCGTDLAVRLGINGRRL